MKRLSMRAAILGAGVASGEAVSLMPGDYTVEVSGEEHAITIETEKRVTLDLNATENLT